MGIENDLKINMTATVRKGPCDSFFDIDRGRYCAKKTSAPD